MRRVRVIFAWVVLIGCGAGWVAGQYISIRWIVGRGSVVGIHCGSVFFLRMDLGRRPNGVEWGWIDEAQRVEARAEQGYTRVRSAPQRGLTRFALVGFFWERYRDPDWPAGLAPEVLPHWVMGFPLWFPAVLAGVWLIRSRIRGRRLRRGFGVAPSSGDRRAWKFMRGTTDERG